MLWRQPAQGWTKELCWERQLSLKSYGGTRTLLVAGGSVSVLTGGLSCRGRGCFITLLQLRNSPIPSHMGCQSDTLKTVALACLAVDHEPLSTSMCLLNVRLDVWQLDRSMRFAKAVSVFSFDVGKGIAHILCFICRGVPESGYIFRKYTSNVWSRIVFLSEFFLHYSGAFF